MRSEIDKNKDALTNLTDSQKFLLDLSPEEFIQARNQTIKDKHESLKKKWIAEHMANP